MTGTVATLRAQHARDLEELRSIRDAALASVRASGGKKKLDPALDRECLDAIAARERLIRELDELADLHGEDLPIELPEIH